MIPWIGQLNNNVARPGKPWPSGVVHICKRAMLISPLESAHFLNMHFYEFDAGFNQSITMMVVS